MLALDEDAVICDLAETYHVYDYRLLPARTVAAFCAGLGENSRIKKKLRNEESAPTLETLLLAKIADLLQTLVYFNTDDGVKGINPPQSIVAAIMKTGNDTDESKYMVFDSIDEYENFQKEKRMKQWQK